MPWLFEDADGPDAYCYRLFPPESAPRVVDELLFGDRFGVAPACSSFDEIGLALFASHLMWKAEVLLAFWGDDAPATIDSFGSAREFCRWVSTRSPGGR